MAKEYLDKNGLLYFWQKIKNTFALATHTHTKSQITDFPTIPSKTSDLTNDSNFVSDSSYVHTDNNYTTTEKNKLSGIAAGAQVNVIETVKVNGTALTPTSKAVDVTVPTKMSDLTNDSDFVSDANYVHTDSNFTSAEKTKLSGIATGAEVNQNAFSNIKVGSSTIAADGKTDTLELVAGSNVTLTPDTTNDKVTIAAEGYTPTARNIDGISFDGSANIHHYGTSSSSAATAAKVATISDNTFTLAVGAIVFVKFTYANSVANATLNVNSTGAKSIYRAGSTNIDSNTSWKAGSVIGFIYDGTSWLIIGGANSYVEGGVNASDSSKVTFTLRNLGGNSSYDLINHSAIGAASGVCPLNASSKIDSTYLPSYVDDVIEAYPRTGQTELSSTWLSATSGGSALTPETGKIYVLMADSTTYAANSQFRWSGTAYVKLADGGVSEITNAEIDVIVAS